MSAHKCIQPLNMVNSDQTRTFPFPPEENPDVLTTAVRKRGCENCRDWSYKKVAVNTFLNYRPTWSNCDSSVTIKSWFVSLLCSKPFPVLPDMLLYVYPWCIFCMCAMQYTFLCWLDAQIGLKCIIFHMPALGLPREDDNNPLTSVFPAAAGGRERLSEVLEMLYTGAPWEDWWGGRGRSTGGWVHEGERYLWMWCANTMGLIGFNFQICGQPLLSCAVAGIH